MCAGHTDAHQGHLEGTQKNIAASYDKRGERKQGGVGWYRRTSDYVLGSKKQ